MTTNLEELDALWLAASAGPWEAVTDDDANDEVRLVEAAPRRHARGGGRIVPVLMMTPKADAECIVALHTAYPAMAEELRALRTENAELREWREEHSTPEDAAIDAAFPTRSGRHDTYLEAMRMVGARHSKGALVALVNWLLIRAECAKGDP